MTESAVSTRIILVVDDHEDLLALIANSLQAQGYTVLAAESGEAALRLGDIAAVVSRGGRPDLAGADALEKVTAPTLLIVGGNDNEVITLNQQAFSALQCEKRIDIIPGATHLFEEKGTLEQVALLAQQWFSNRKH